ncbi:hypothetical protein ACFQ7A_03800 [Streptomyces sp. NPDC056528]
MQQVPYAAQHGIARVLGRGPAVLRRQARTNAVDHCGNRLGYLRW